jgi:hypothetical protein
MTGDVSNHLWQSTLFAVAAGLLASAWRRNQARIRYWLRFSASAKFFVPFTLLITFGSNLDWAPTAQHITPPAVSFAIGQISQISQPFSDASLVAEGMGPSRPGDAGRFIIAILALVWMSGAALLYLGPAATLTRTPQEPSIYLDAAYRAEINRRNQIRGLPLLPNAIPFEPNTVSPRPMRP